jgi:hypothetical protein
MVSRVLFCLLLTTCAVLLPGCTGGDDNPATFPVSGTVTLNGEPVAGAQVSFMGQGVSLAASGTTDAQGKYQLSTFGENDGAVLGKHVVTISPSATIGGGEEMNAEDPSSGYGEAMAAAAAGKQVGGEGGIPARYGMRGTSKLEAQVTKDGPNEFSFPLEP